MRFLLAVALGMLAGCAGLFMRAPQFKAASPLAGAPLEGFARPTLSLVRSMRADDCSTFPLDDEYQIAVDGDRVCAEVTIAVPLGMGGERTTSISLFGPNAGEVIDDDVPKMRMFDGEMRLAFRSDTGQSEVIQFERVKRPRKIGECRDHRSGAPFAIWTQPYRGCAANDGRLLGEATRTLAVQRDMPLSGRVDLIAWSFR